MNAERIVDGIVELVEGAIAGAVLFAIVFGPALLFGRI